MIHTKTKKNYLIEKVKQICHNHKRFQTVEVEPKVSNGNGIHKKDDIVQRNKIVKITSPRKNSDNKNSDLSYIKKSNFNLLSKNFKKD